jgi:hypothetical protein
MTACDVVSVSENDSLPPASLSSSSSAFPALDGFEMRMTGPVLVPITTSRLSSSLPCCGVVSGLGVTPEEQKPSCFGQTVQLGRSMLYVPLSSPSGNISRYAGGGGGYRLALLACCVPLPLAPVVLLVSLVTSATVELLLPPLGRILSLPAFHWQQHWTCTAHWITQHLCELVHELAKILRQSVRSDSRKMVSRISAITLPSGSRLRSPTIKENATLIVHGCCLLKNCHFSYRLLAVPCRYVPCR